MMRWKTMFVGLALSVTVAAGCKQEVFLHECTMQEAKSLGLPKNAECNPDFQPPTTDVPPPMTVQELTRETYNLTLTEAIAQALEHGTTGLQSTRLTLGSFGSPANASIANDDLLTYQGAPNILIGSDSIRVLALDPAVLASDIEVSLSRFDAFWRTSMTWSASDQPNQGLNTFQNGNFASFLSEVIKPLAGGGAISLSAAGSYQNLTRPTPGFTLTNPAYQPSLTLTYDQPLLQAFGVDINQIRQLHPNTSSTSQALEKQPSLYTSNGINGPAEGILITRVRFDQSRAEFERAVSFMVANVEVAYWGLYDAYLQLYSTEQAMRLAHTIWKLTKLSFDAGKTAAKDYYPQLAQYEQFRGDRLRALGVVLERERQLRALMGLQVEDGRRLVPIDRPTLAPFKPDWTSAVNETLSLRPELVILRQDLKIRQFRLLRAKNDLLPDLRFTSSYGINALGTRLDGNSNLPSGLTDNALRSLASNHFNNWSLGLTLNVPIGYRAAYATVHQARLQLAQGYYQLRDQEDKATRFLAQVYRAIFEQYDTIQVRRAQRLGYSEQLKAKLQEIDVGKSLPDLQLLDALRQWSAALQQEFDAVANYNNALVGFEFAKGTLLKHDNIMISEGPLPACAQVRAVEHERQRSKAIVLCERASPAAKAACCGANGLALPQVLDADPPSVAALLPGTSGAEAAPSDMAASKVVSQKQENRLPPARIVPVPARPFSVPDRPTLPDLKPAQPPAVPAEQWTPAAADKSAAPSKGYTIILD
jgi:outer membrane protein TolC